jgi:hypothetical protein
MNENSLRHHLAIALAILLVLANVGWVAAASGSPTLPPHATPGPGSTLTAQPSILSSVLKAGDVNVTKVTLTAGIDLDITIGPFGLGESPDGNFLSLAQGQDLSPFTARGWLQADPAVLHLSAHESREITITIRVPKDAGEGTRYAILQINGKPSSGDGNVGVGVTLGLSVLVTIANTSLYRTAELDGLAVELPLGAPLALSAVLKNTGDTHFGSPPYAVTTAATVQPIGASTLATARSTMTGNSVVPTFGRRVDLSLKPVSPLADGRYHVEMESRMQDGTLLARAALDFQVSNNAIAEATAAPSVGLPQSGGGIDGMTLALGLLVGAALAAIVFALLGRRRRGPRGKPPSRVDDAAGTA